MNKTYLIAPAAALVLFFAYWYGFKAEYEKKIQDAQTAAENLRLEKKAKDRKDREDAIAAAVQANAQRKAEREAKQAKEKKEKEDREAAIENRNKIKSEQYKLDGQQQRLAKEITVLKEEVSKVELSIKSVETEKAAVKEYVKKAELNQKAITAAADKIEKADDSIKRTIKDLAALRAKSS